MSDCGKWLLDVLSRPLSDFVVKDAPRLKESATVREAAEAMLKSGLGAALVEHADGSLGIITERDVLYKVVARGLDPNATRIGEISSRPLLTISIDSRVGDAIAEMARRGRRRLGVVDGSGRLIGIVTMEKLMGSSVPLLRPAEGYMCPFCGSTFKDKEELSKHIDLVHVGLGLLEGNVARWMD